jgi:hypothetical protein
MVPRVAMASIDLSDYIPVAERIAAFKNDHPEGRLQSEVVDTGHADYIAVKAYAYRSPEDPMPGVGLAWERVPGPTPFTKDSELQNAETAAWGRALVAALVADTSRGIASRDEVAQHSEAPTESEADRAFRWVGEESQVFKEWSKTERTKAYKTAMEMLAYDGLSTMVEAQNIFEHMRNAYETR